jgi:competence protein ComEA
MDGCKATTLWRSYAALALCATLLWILLLFSALAGEGQELTIIALDSAPGSAKVDSTPVDGQRQSAERHSSPPCININSATAVDLQELPGIGAVLAQRIIDYRSTQGPFADLQALCKVKGIGPKTAARFSAQLCF